MGSIGIICIWKYTKVTEMTIVRISREWGTERKRANEVQLERTARGRDKNISQPTYVLKLDYDGQRHKTSTVTLKLNKVVNNPSFELGALCHHVIPGPDMLLWEYMPRICHSEACATSSG